jgi:hypothetical protein
MFGKIAIPKEPTRKDKEIDVTLSNLKGDISSTKYVEEVLRLADAIKKAVEELDKNAGVIDDVLGKEMMYKLLPESVGKTGKDLEFYVNKFNDALYVYFRLFRSIKSKVITEFITRWETDHRYLEGR